MARQPKTLDDMQETLHYSGVVLTEGTSRQAIRDAITASGMTQEVVAERMKMSPVTISRWLNGQTDPSFAKLDALARQIGRPITLTFGGESETAPAPQWVRGLQRALAAVLQDRGISPNDAWELSEAWGPCSNVRVSSNRQLSTQCCSIQTRERFVSTVEHQQQLRLVDESPDTRDEHESLPCCTPG